MLRSLRNLEGFVIQEHEGDLGRVADIYFDERSWKIEHFLVDVGGWWSGKQVLLQREALNEPDWDVGVFPMNTIRTSATQDRTLGPVPPASVPAKSGLEPDVRPASAGNVFGEPLPEWMMRPLSTEGTEALLSWLRSVHDITGCRVQGSDAEIGHVEDLLVDEANWRIRYLVIDTTTWLPSQLTLIAPDWIKEFRWIEGNLVMDLNRDAVDQSPAHVYLRREFEAALFRQS